MYSFRYYRRTKYGEEVGGALGSKEAFRVNVQSGVNDKNPTIWQVETLAAAGSVSTCESLSLSNAQVPTLANQYSCNIGAPMNADVLSASTYAKLDATNIRSSTSAVYTLRARFLFRYNKASLATALCAPRCTPQVFVAFQYASAAGTAEGLTGGIVGVVVLAICALCCLLNFDFNKRLQRGSGATPNRAATVPMHVEMAVGAPVTSQELVSAGASNFSNGDRRDTAFLGRENPQSVNLSSNDITTIAGLHQCHHLRVLNLSNNDLTRLTGIVAARALVKLDVSNNNLTDLGGLQSATLQVLLCRNNDITALSSVRSMGLYAEPTCLPALQSIDAQDNSITSLQGVEGFPALQTANFANNNISSIASVQSCVNLRDLDMRANALDGAKLITVQGGAPGQSGGVSEASDAVLLNSALVLQFLARVDVRSRWYMRSV
jgi:hypothetical protein